MENNTEGADVSLLSESGTNCLRKNPTLHCWVKSWVLVLVFISGVLVTSAVWAAAWTFRMHSILPSSPTVNYQTSRELHCGSSPAEARSRDCKLQVWSYTWIPEPCFDYELNAKFVSIYEKNDLPYYMDANGTEMVDFATVCAGEVEELNAVWGSHFWHCQFAISGYFRRGEGTEVKTDPEHLKHCSKWLTDPFRYEWKKVNAKALLKYETCNVRGL